MNKRNIFMVAVLLLILAVGIYLRPEDKFGPFEHPFPVSDGDTVESWDVVGLYEDGGELEAKANSEIERLKGLFGGDFSDYELYVSIANQYDLLGDMEKNYEYLGRALVIDSENTGLAWHNMGRLMERLGAFRSARIAFERAIKAQPLPVYYMAKIDFLEKNFPDNKEEIEQTKMQLNGADPEM